MRAAVEQCVVETGQGCAHCTISIGVGHRQAGVELDAVLREADAALYEAKRCGRNQVRRLAA